MDHDWVKAPRSSTGWTERLLYTLEGSFSTAERKKASKIRSRTHDERGEEVGSGLLTPVSQLRRPTVADFSAQPTADELLLLGDGPA